MSGAPSTGGAKRKFDSASNGNQPDKRVKRDGPATSASGSTKKPWSKDWKKGSDKKKPLILSRKDRQEKKRERKAAKPNADIIAEANKVWQTSFTQMSAKERSENIGALLAHMSGKMQEVGLKHDASRAIQLAIKYASEEQKHTIIKELTGHFRQLSEEHYGHYIIIKLLSNDTKKGEAKKLCLKEFKTHIGKPDSAKVLDYLYASSPKKDQNSILQEFYSPEFVVFAEDEATKDKSLTEILAAKPEKKNQILENLRKYLDKSLEKNMIMFRFIHALLLQYLSHVTMAETESKEYLSNLYQYIPALHHSQDGCRIICHLLSVGTAAKDRKGILKYFKGLVGNMSDRPEGVWVLSTALDVVDDTVLLDKTIFAELLPNLKDQLSHPNASRIYLHVLNPADSSIFAKEEQANYSVSGRWILNAELAAEVTKAGMLSKKDPTVKRLELLSFCLLPLVSELSTRPDLLASVLRENFGHHLLTETIKEAWRLINDDEAQAAAAAPAPAAEGKKKKGKAVKAEEEDADADAEPAAAPAAGSRFPAGLAKKLGQLSTQLNLLLDSLVSECASPLGQSSGDKGEKSNPLEDRFGHYALKRIIALQPTPDRFLEKLLDTTIESDMLLALAKTNRPAFVLASILEKDLPIHAARLKKELKSHVKELIAASGVKPVAPVKEEEAAAAPSSNKFAKKNAPVYNSHSTTSAGVDLLAKLIQGLPTEKTGKPAAPAAAAAASAVDATPAKRAKAAPATASKSTKKGAKAAAPEPVKMEIDDEEEPAPAPVVAKTPAKKAAPKKAATATKSAKKKATTADDMEE